MNNNNSVYLEIYVMKNGKRYNIKSISLSRLVNSLTKVYMTTALFTRLLGYTKDIQINGTQYTALFGCRVKVFPGKELLWIVGYEGKAEEGE